MQDVETFDLRTSCAYEYVSTTFTCPGYNFNAMVTGIDAMGYLYQRIKPIFCFGGPSEGSCQHGGAYNNGRCYCQKYWTGENCEKAICVNGGVLQPSGMSCDCRRGYAGNFCEIPRCEPIMPAVHRSADNRTFVLVLDGSMSSAMLTINQNITGLLTTVLTNIQQTFPNWFSKYVGVVALDSAVPAGRNITSATVNATTIADFAAQMAAALLPAYQTGVCSKWTLTGLVQVLTSPHIGYRDEVFILTAAAAGDWILEGAALNAITRTHAYVNIITLTDMPCGSGYQDPAMAVFFNLAQISGGGFYQITPTVIGNFWSSLLSTYYSSSWLTFSSYANCANITQYVQVGINSTVVTVDIFGIDPPYLNVQNPNGTYVLPNMLYPGQHSTLDQFMVRGFPGLYTLRVNQGNTTEQGKPCLVKTRGSSPVMVYVGFTQSVGIDNGVHSDQVSGAPVIGRFANALVAAVTPGAMLTYVQFLDLSDGTILWSSPLQIRDSCAFLYISNVFTCPTSSFAVAVEGTDFEGHPIRRINNFHCVGMPAPTLVPQSTTPSAAPPTTSLATTMSTTSTMPTTTTPLPSCDLKAAVADLVFLFDDSNGMSSDDYRGTVLAFLELMSSATISPDFVRVAMGTFDTQAHFSGDFNSINSSDAYQTALFNTWGTPQTGIYGNNIDDALNQIVNLTTPEHGYRLNATDMIVIISSTGWTEGNGGQGFNDPADTAHTLRRAGMNIVAIGYGQNANMQQLQAISPCAQFAPDLQAFTALIPWINSRLCLGGTQFC